MVILPTHNNSTCFMLFQHPLNGFWHGFAHCWPLKSGLWNPGPLFLPKSLRNLEIPSKKNKNHSKEPHKGNSSSTFNSSCYLGLFGVRIWVSKLGAPEDSVFPSDAQKMEPANASLVPSVPTDKNLVADRSLQATIKDVAYHVVPIYVCVCACTYVYWYVYIYIYVC